VDGFQIDSRHSVSPQHTGLRREIQKGWGSLPWAKCRGIRQY